MSRSTVRVTLLSLLSVYSSEFDVLMTVALSGMLMSADQMNTCQAPNLDTFSLLARGAPAGLESSCLQAKYLNA